MLKSAGPLVIKFYEITRYREDFDRNKYLTIINDDKNNRLLLLYKYMWKEIENSIKGKNDDLYNFPYSDNQN